MLFCLHKHMATPSYEIGLMIGDTIEVESGAVKYFAYRCMWDRGNVAHILIFDPDLSIHNQLAALDVKTPTPAISFGLSQEFTTQPNKGSPRVLYALKFGLLKLNNKMFLKVIAVDKGGVSLKQTDSFFQNGVKAGKFCNELAKRKEVTSEIPATGDPESVHRALQANVIDHIRYELDRTLSANGHPISLQYDDRNEKLMGYENNYGESSQTQLIEGVQALEAIYNLGPVSESAGGSGAGFGSAIYDYESVQDYSAAVWGHKVTVDQLDYENQHTVGKLTSKLHERVGIGGKVLQGTQRRLHVPHEPTDSNVPDDFRVKAVMTNQIFQAEMGMTYGSILVDADFEGYDDPAILNQKHLKIAISVGSSEHTDPDSRALIPEKAVIMGWAHVIDTTGKAKTRIFFRRGN